MRLPQPCGNSDLSLAGAKIGCKAELETGNSLVTAAAVSALRHDEVSVFTTGSSLFILQAHQGFTLASHQSSPSHYSPIRLCTPSSHALSPSVHIPSSHMTEIPNLSLCSAPDPPGRWTFTRTEAAIIIMSC
jgi:hypothetical protein